MFQKVPKSFETALVKMAEQELEDAGWEQVSANRWRRPDGQEFSMSDAIRVLNKLPALECGTTWPLPSA